MHAFRDTAKKYGKYEIAESKKIMKSTDMKDAKKKYSPDELNDAIKHKKTDEVCCMIQAGVLEEMNNEELKSIFQSLMTLRSKEVVDLLAKKSHYFPIEMLDIEIKNHNDKSFVSYVLEQYGKKFRYKSPDTANRLFEVACSAECKPFLLFLLGKGLAEGQYPRLISGSVNLLDVLSQVKVSALHPDTIVTFFMEAASSENADKRINELIELDFDITTENSEGLTACEAMRKGIDRYPYGKDKRAKKEKQQDLQGLKTLERAYRNYINA